MKGLAFAFVLLMSVVYVLAIPSSLMSDVKEAEMSHARLSNKVKRAQEVIMFGNQQNRGGDVRNGFQRAEKRGRVDLEDNVLSDSVTDPPRSMFAESESDDDSLEEPKVMAQYDKSYRLGEPEYAQRPQNSVLKSEYFMDPVDLNDFRFYKLDERRKRETFRTPTKRSSRGLATTGRAKRDLDTIPDELEALLTYWKNQREKHYRDMYRDMYNQYNMSPEEVDMFLREDGANDVLEEDEPRPDGWMDGPVAVPAQHFTANAEPWGRQRFSEDRRKRFMVSKRRPQEGDIYSLAQLLNSSQRDAAAAPVFRRYVL